jgi:predicted DNA-binding protein (MmcQ/YjbR family)
MSSWTPAEYADSLAHLQEICLALPEATQELTWDEINFRVRKKIFCFPGQGGSISIKADRAELPALLDDPRFSPAPYLARGGWVLMDLQREPVDWDEIRELIDTSYVLIAPKTLGRQVLAIND